MRQYIDNVSRNLRTTNTAKINLARHRGRCASRFSAGNGARLKLGICDFAEYTGKHLSKMNPSHDASLKLVNGTDEFFSDQEQQNIYHEDDIKIVDEIRELANPFDSEKLLKRLSKYEDYHRNARQTIQNLLAKRVSRPLLAPSFDSTGVPIQSLEEPSVVANASKDTAMGNAIWDKLITKPDVTDAITDGDTMSVENTSLWKMSIARSATQMNLSRRATEQQRYLDTMPTLDDFFTADSPPSVDQRNVLELFYNQAKSMHLSIKYPGIAYPKLPQLAHFLHGGPGTGKTWTFNKAHQIRNAFGYNCPFMAFTGAASALLPGASTIHSVLDIPTRLADGQGVNYIVDRTTPGQLTRLQAKKPYWEKQHAVSWDEFSMITSVITGKGSQSVMAFRGNEDQTPFGGLDYYFSGDFLQLDPVQGTRIVNDVLIDIGI